MEIDKNTIKNFFDKVLIVDGDNCWEWLGYCRKQTTKIFPYGKLSGGFTSYAHRFSYVFHNGVIPRGMIVRHTCDNPSCVNPKHLVLGTPKDNTRDMLERGREAKGENHGRAKLKEKDVLDIYNSQERIHTLSKHYGVSDSQIERIKKKQRWKFLLDKVA